LRKLIDGLHILNRRGGRIHNDPDS
jgi:hypothetical protein